MMQGTSGLIPGLGARATLFLATLVAAAGYLALSAPRSVYARTLASGSQ